MLFAQFGDSVARLTSLLSVHLDHPVNAMTAVCKRLTLPKKAALEAISMFEMAVGNDEATAHDVFVAMQEIPFTLKTQGVPERMPSCGPSRPRTPSAGIRCWPCGSTN